MHKYVLNINLRGPSVVAVFMSLHWGDQLAEILKQEGCDFGALEVRIKQMVAESESSTLQSGWHTAISLKALGWTECQPHFLMRWWLVLFLWVQLGL